MSMVKPILGKTAAFDASQEHIFEFLSIGGNQVVKNRLTIRDNVSNSIVYNKEQETYVFEHKLPANTLTNGKYYNAVLITYDSDGNSSVASDPIQFYCYTSPIIQFTNIPETNLIQNSSFNFEFTYTQREKELLGQYKINLYNSSKNVISTSGIIYLSGSAQPPLNLSYLIKGFDDSSSYFIECTGVTVNGTEVETGLLPFTVKYLKPTVYGVIELTNNCKEGYITAKSNIAIIEGESNPSPPVYIEDKEVDITGDGWWVDFNKGYEIKGDFTVKLWCRSLKVNKQFFTLKNKNGDMIQLIYRKGYETNDGVVKSHIELNVAHPDSPVPYIIFSNFIPVVTDKEQLFVLLRKINNVYQLKVENKGAVSHA